MHTRVCNDIGSAVYVVSMHTILSFYGTFPHHDLASPQMTKQPGVWVCAYACVRVCVWALVTANTSCRLFHSWCFNLSRLESDKRFPTAPTCRRLKAAHIQPRTHSLTLRHYMAMPDIIGRFYKKKEPLLFFCLCVHSGCGAAEQKHIVLFNPPWLWDQRNVNCICCTEQENLQSDLTGLLTMSLSQHLETALMVGICNLPVRFGCDPMRLAV